MVNEQILEAQPPGGARTALSCFPARLVKESARECRLVAFQGRPSHLWVVPSVRGCQKLSRYFPAPVVCNVPLGQTHLLDSPSVASPSCSTAKRCWTPPWALMGKDTSLHEETGTLGTTTSCIL